MNEPPATLVPAPGAAEPETPGDRPLILASGSPRRVELLRQLGLPFHVVVSDVPETVGAGVDPLDHAPLLAERKASAVAGRHAAGLVLGADTIVLVDDQILGKPHDADDAAAMLRRLSGRAHLVVTGLALVDAATGSCQRGATNSIVTMRELSQGDIAAYVATGEPLDKAGAYAIQGLGGGLIASLDGCFTNVVGLPLCQTTTFLANAGVQIPRSWAGCRLADGSPCPNAD